MRAFPIEGARTRRIDLEAHRGGLRGQAEGLREGESQTLEPESPGSGYSVGAGRCSSYTVGVDRGCQCRIKVYPHLQKHTKKGAHRAGNLHLAALSIEYPYRLTGESKDNPVICQFAYM